MYKAFVIMSTFNGQKYLRKQIDSILNQKGVNVNLIVRDDGSTDNTINILKEYENKNKLKLFIGKNIGPARSFFTLLNNKYININEKNTVVAFSDQDDIWKLDKLKRACDALKNSTKPALYLCNFYMINEYDKNLGTFDHLVTTSLSHSMVGSGCTGCTMVINIKLCRILRRYFPKEMYMHDDWIHKLCLAVGGQVIFDKAYFGVNYRQHSNNVIGVKTSLVSKIKRYYLRLDKNRDCMLNEFIDIKKKYKDLIPLQNLLLINEMIHYKSYSLVKRIRFINEQKFKLYPKRYTRMFKLAIILKRY